MTKAIDGISEYFILSPPTDDFPHLNAARIETQPPNNSISAHLAYGEVFEKINIIPQI
ncbi:hypothetical protein PSE_2980 [Pseudovibrio sp. FO-BEG1]|nr:hypothetical protein PSE_2980 [Pseudovibrio sp. FO-BEG1]